ncbi:MAG: hypothetical protein Q4F65_09500, partial [Propionibacteriaceae bacterium]|nr:hypothetical protein [Propionibacteriaceae bacterium]
MVPDAATVAAVFAPRLADLIAPHALSLLVAPAEYRPGDLARAAMDELHGRDGYRSVRVPEDIPELLQALAERDPVIVEVVNDSFEVVDAMRVEITRHLGVLPSVERLVAVLVTDTIPDHVSDQPFTLVLDHRDLAATRDEVAATVPDIRGQAMLIGRVLNHTGGAAGLLHITDPESVGYPERVVQASIPWAERIHDEVTADDRLRTLLWCGRIATDTLATVLGELTGQRPSLSDLEALRGLPYVTAPAHLPPGLPRGLSVALQRLALERDPESTAALCRSLSGLVVTNERIRATDRILLATTLRDWEAINSILASKGYLLALAERE